MNKLLAVFGLAAALAGSPAISAEYDVDTLIDKRLGDHDYYSGMFYGFCPLYKVGF